MTCGKLDKLDHMSLEVISGPMFSGKSTELVRRLQANRRVKTIYVNSTKDTRAKGTLSVRGAMVKEQDFPVATFVKVEKLSEVDIETYTVVLVDEAQFFDDLVEFVRRCLTSKKRVVVAGLNGNYRAEPFGHVHELLPFAHSVNIITAVCSCGADALFSKNKLVDQVDLSRVVPAVNIGDDETYEPVCFGCFTKKDGERG